MPERSEALRLCQGVLFLFSLGFLGFSQEDRNLSWSDWNNRSANSKLLGTLGLRQSVCRNMPLERSDLLAAWRPLPMSAMGQDYRIYASSGSGLDSGVEDSHFPYLQFLHPLVLLSNAP